MPYSTKSFAWKLDGKYSERVQLPAKVKFGGFLSPTLGKHLPHLLLEVQNVNNRRSTEFFDRYFHIPLPIVTKHEVGLPFPPRNHP